jgi:hypothetical protein
MASKSALRGELDVANEACPFGCCHNGTGRALRLLCYSI